MAFVCDVAVWFNDRSPSRQIYIGEDRKARDEQHAITLALLDIQAKGYNIRKENINEVFVMGGRVEPTGVVPRKRGGEE